jgi:hypothetical protein
MPAWIARAFPALLLCCAAIWEPAAQAQQQGRPLIVGVNQVGLAWVPPAQRAQIIEDMERNKVRVVRMSLNPPFEASLDAVDLATRQGIQVLLTISLNAKDYFEPSAQQRKGERLVDAYPLSQISPERFREVFGKVWAGIEQRRIKLLGIQVGNEINWSFNGDLAVGGAGQVYRSAEDLAKAPGFLAGLDRYVQLVQSVRQLRDGSAVNRDTLVLAAGMARINPGFAAQMHADAVDAGLALSLLKQRGLDRYADAAAMHQYPMASDTPGRRAGALEDALKDCRVGGTAHACWLTEWGFSNNAAACPVDDQARTALVRETRQNLLRAARAGEVEAVFYFEWNGKTPRSIWRCGGLTEAGVAAIQPDDAPVGKPR